MRFEWDGDKNRLNIAKHGLDLAGARELFSGRAPFLAGLDARSDRGEERWKGIGVLRGNTVVVAIFTERGGDVIRVISLRRASNHERKRYEEEIRNRLGEG